jgi:hypothetical protein
MDAFEGMQRWLPLNEAEFEFAHAAVSGRLAEGENIEDVFAGSAYLGARRASLFERRPSASDLEFALSIFTWWRFKPDPPPDVEEQLRSIRRDAFEGARFGRVEILDSLVSIDTLRLGRWELYLRQRVGIGAFLNV